MTISDIIIKLPRMEMTLQEIIDELEQNGIIVAIGSEKDCMFSFVSPL